MRAAHLRDLDVRMETMGVGDIREALERRRNRFFAEDVDAAADRFDRHGGMVFKRAADDEHVRLGRVQHASVVTVESGRFRSENPPT